MTQYVNSGTAGSIQAGAAAAIRQGEPFVREIRQRIKTGLDLAYEKLAGMPGIVLPEKPHGGMYVFFAFEGESDASRVCTEILEKARVGLAPGHLFGNSANAFLRMCVCRDREQVAKALDRMLDMR
jgi:aspartate/methionine/tyrosine aminotransferase